MCVYLVNLYFMECWENRSSLCVVYVTGVSKIIQNRIYIYQISMLRLFLETINVHKDCNKNYKPTENSLLIDKYVQNCVVYTLNSEKYHSYKYFSAFRQLSWGFSLSHVQITCLLRAYNTSKFCTKLSTFSKSSGMLININCAITVTHWIKQ